MHTQVISIRYLQTKLIDIASSNPTAAVSVPNSSVDNFFSTFGEVWVLHFAHHVWEYVLLYLSLFYFAYNRSVAFEVKPTFLHGRHMLLALISRRSRFRAGTRYFRRGIDHSGHVANFNESEQILLIEAQASPESVRANDDSYVTKLSFVQIRGSVPVFWSEINTLRYKPDLQIMDLQDTVCFSQSSSLWH